MAKPATHIDWLQGNGSIGSRIETPAGALTLNGYSPGDTPKSKNFNFCLYYLDQWDRWAETEIDSLTTAVAGKQASGNYITGLTGEVTASGPGSAAATIAAGAITNAKVASNASIQFSKMEALALSKIMVTSGTGVAAASAVDATQLNYLDVTASIQTQLDAKASTSDLATTNGNVSAVSTSLSFHTGASSGVHGITGSVVGTTDAQVLTSKDIDGGTASNSSRLTLAKNSIANLIALTRKQGNSFYSTDMLKQVVDNGTTLEPLALAAQAMGINLITNNSDAQGWSKTGTVFATPATTTVAANLPLAGITNSAIQFVATGSGTEATNYNSFSVTTPAAMNGKVQIDFFLRPGTGFAANEWTVSVYQGSTRQALSADSSSVCYIPNTTGRFTVSFDALASTAYTLRFARVSGSGSATLNVCNVFFGWPFVSQTAANDDWQTYTPTIGGLGTGTTNINTGRWRRVGDSMDVEVTWSTNAVGTGATAVTIPLPGTYTIDTTKATGANANGIDTFGVFTFYTGTAFNNTAKITGNGTSNAVAIIKPSTAGFYTGADFVASTQGSAKFTVPIVGWGSTVSIGPGAQVEYAHNTSGVTAAGAVDTTSFGYGPQGVAIGSINSTTGGNSTTSMRVRFQYPIQADDLLFLEFDGGSNGARWQDATTLFQYGIFQGTSIYGAYLNQISSTDVDVVFGNRGRLSNNATYGGDGSPWSVVATNRWRVRKAKASSPVGFGLAGTDGSAGLYKPGQAPGYTGGAAIPAGCVGEKITWASAPVNQSLTTTETDWTNAFITLTPGVWLIQASIAAICNPASSVGAYVASVARITDSSNVLLQNMDKQVYYVTPAASSGTVLAYMSFSAVVSLSSSTVYKIRGLKSEAGGVGLGQLYNSTSARSEFFGVRIA